MKMKTTQFDLILVLTTFRRSSAFLPIISYLCRKNKHVGLYVLDIKENTKNKTSSTNQVFIEFCSKLGAEIIFNETVSTKIAILPQSDFDKWQIESIKKNIQSQKFFWLVGLTMGNFCYENLRDIEIDKVLVIDTDLYHYRLKKRPEEKEAGFSNDQIIEIGLPYDKYQVMDDLEIDYLWANPTPLSLPEAKDRLNYLKYVKKLVDQIPENEIIALKPHNADERHDYVVNSKILKIYGWLPFTTTKKTAYLMAKGIEKMVPKGKICTIMQMIQMAYIYLLLMQRVTPLSSITSFHNFSLELFMPNVKKGLITGRSNSIWHGLFLKKPVYNCVDGTTIDVNKSKMNYHSMEFFEVPFCNGELKFEPRYFDVIRDEVREKNLIQILDSATVRADI